MYEENLNQFLSGSISLKHPHEAEADTKVLSCKPNDIEKLSTNDSILLIIFDTKKSAPSHSTSARSSDSNRLRLLKFKKFLKYSTNFKLDTIDKKQRLRPSTAYKKYQLSDNYYNQKTGFIGKNYNKPDPKTIYSTGFLNNFTLIYVNYRKLTFF